MTHRTASVKQGEKKLETVVRDKLKALGRQAARAAVNSALHQLAPKHQHTHGIKVHVIKADDGLDRAAIIAAAEASAQAALDAMDWEVLVDPTELELAAVAADGARQALLRLGIDDQGITDQVYATAQQWAEARAAELVGMKYNAAGDLVDNPNAEFAITDGTRNAVRELVEQAIAEGKAADTLASEIEASAPFDADRAAMIARTEIIRANNQGHMAAFRASGVVQQKEWSTAEDGDVCPECMANEDQGPIGLESDFQSGDEAAPAHPNCRCTIIAVIDFGDKSDEPSDQGDEE